MSSKQASLLLVILIAFSVILSFSQAYAKGNIWGYIRDADTLKPISGALFEAIPQDEGVVQAQAHTNDQGYFELTATPGKTYQFKASADGYLPNETPGITVPTGHDLPFDNILLQKAPTAGFAIQPVINNAAVVAGEKGTYTLVLTAAPQFSGSVNVDIRSNIASTGYTVLPNSNVELKPRENFTVNVIVSTERNLQPGTYNFIVTANSGEITQTAIMTLTVYAAPQTFQEQIATATVSIAPIILVCAVSVIIGFLIGRRKPSRSDPMVSSR